MAAADTQWISPGHVSVCLFQDLHGSTGTVMHHSSDVGDRQGKANTNLKTKPNKIKQTNNNKTNKKTPKKTHQKEGIFSSTANKIAKLKKKKKEPLDFIQMMHK